MCVCAIAYGYGCRDVGIKINQKGVFYQAVKKLGNIWQEYFNYFNYNQKYVKYVIYPHLFSLH